jgi:hypothetical protein
VILDGLTWLGGEAVSARPADRSGRPPEESATSQDDGVVPPVGRSCREYLRRIARHLPLVPRVAPPGAPPVARRIRTRENP